MLNGLGDPAFYLYGRLWSSNFDQGLGRRAWLSAIFSVKTPWGKNDRTEDGERIDEHAQPGTGATNLSGGLSFLYLFDAESSIYTSAAYTGTGRNKFGYKYGNNVQVNAVYDRKLTDWLDGLFEVNFLDAKRDQQDAAGLQDPNTGGQTLYLTPRVAVHVTHGLVAAGGGAISGVEKPERNSDRRPDLHRGADVRVLGRRVQGSIFAFGVAVSRATLRMERVSEHEQDSDRRRVIQPVQRTAPGATKTWMR